MLKILAWIFALLNVFPLLWMAWSSLLGASEIMQGKILPDPYPNDLVFFEKFPDGSLVAGTLHGQVYRFENGSLENSPKSLDLRTTTVGYARDSSSLYAFSSDGGLLSIDPLRLQKKRAWTFRDFKKSFERSDFTPFLFVPNQTQEKEFARLGAMLDSVPLVENSNWTLADMLGKSFPRDSALVGSLNGILEKPKLLARVLSEWQGKTDWVNPAIGKLFKKRNRTAFENRELFRWCLAERIPSMLTIYRRISWTPIWVNRVPASDHGVSVAVAGNYLCVGMWWEPFPGIAIVEKNSPEKVIHWVTPQNGLPSSSVQRILRVSDREVLVAHDQGFSLVDIQAKKVLSNYPFGESGLPFYNGRDLRISVVNRSSVIFSFGREMVFFDFRAGQAVKRLYADSRLFPSDISAVKSFDGKVFFGISDGLVSMNLWDLLSEVKTQKSVSVGGTATSLSVDGGEILVGMQGGMLAKVRMSAESVDARYALPEGRMRFHLRNYEDLWRMIPFGRFLANSLVICLSTVLICLLIGSLAGYGLARMSFRHRHALNGGLVASQVIPNILFLIPSFLILSYLQIHTQVHLLNTRIGIILLYSALFLPMATWILLNMFRMLPREIEEAALMDGCTPLSAFFRVALPSALPGIFTTGVYIFILAWDELMFAWVFSFDLSSATIPVGMRLFFGQFGSRFDLMMAAATLSTLPVVMLFLFMQRHLLRGFPGGRNVVHGVLKKNR